MLEDIDFEKEKIQAGMMIVFDYIDNKRSVITGTAGYYLDYTIKFFGNIKNGLMSLLYPRKIELDYDSLSPVGSEFVEINNAIEPVIDRKSRKEMLSRVRKIKGIESQLKEMEENPKNFYQRADATELAKICEKIKDIVQPAPIQVSLFDYVIHQLYDA
jgi:hypothetical protein